MKLSNIILKTLIIILIALFLFFYFLYLRVSYINLNLIIFLGLIIIFIVIFYFFLTIDSSNNKKIKIIFLNEYLARLILFFFMSITIFIPSISFSDIIVSWNKVSTLNYIRGIILILGALFIPGSCIFNLILPNSSIYKRLNVKPFVMKLTIYPIISLTYLGTMTLILDFFEFNQFFIFLILFLSFIFLILLDVFFNREKVNKQLKNKRVKVKISKYDLLLFIIGLGIIMISFGTTLLSHPYLLPGDRWRGMASASFIGLRYIDPFTQWLPYCKYWGLIIYSLSLMTGLPYINTGVLLLCFLYLSIMSIYIFIKALFYKNNNEKFIVLASILGVILFKSALIIFQFSYHTFSFYSFFLSLALFTIVIKSENNKIINKLKTENIILLALASLFLIHSLFTYFFPALMGIIFILTFCLLSDNFKQYIKSVLIFYIFFVIFFIILNTMAYNFFSFQIMRFLSTFLNINFKFIEKYPPHSYMRYSASTLLFYPLLLSPLIIISLLNKFSDTISAVLKEIKIKFIKLFRKKENNIFKKKGRYIYIFLAIVILTLWILANLNLESYFIIVFINILRNALGYIGFLGILFSYLWYKERKKLLLFLFCCCMIIIGAALLVFFIRWFQYPTYLVSEIPINVRDKMWHWWGRLNYYSKIPIAILFSIGLIKLIQKSLNLCRSPHFPYKIKTFKNLHKLASIPLISLLIFSFFSSPINSIMSWDSYPYGNVTHEYAQVMGWISKNVPRDSQILYHPSQIAFYRLDKDLYLYETYYLSEEMNKALKSYDLKNKDIYNWHINNKNNGDVNLFYKVENRTNVMIMENKADSGDISIIKNFTNSQTNGTLSFYLKMDTGGQHEEGGILIRIYGVNFTEGIYFYLNNNYHYIYNETSNSFEKTNVMYNTQDWNYYELNFICNQTLSYWNVSLNKSIMRNNDTGESEFKFKGSPSNFSSIQVYNEYKNSSYKIYFDDFDFSWENRLERDYHERILVNDMTKLIYYLNSSNNHYYIVDRDYYYQDQELIDYYYRNILYEYGSCIIYRTEQLKNE